MSDRISRCVLTLIPLCVPVCLCFSGFALDCFVFYWPAWAFLCLFEPVESHTFLGLACLGMSGPTCAILDIICFLVLHYKTVSNIGCLCSKPILLTCLVLVGLALASLTLSGLLWRLGLDRYAKTDICIGIGQIYCQIRRSVQPKCTSLSWLVLAYLGLPGIF